MGCGLSPFPAYDDGGPTQGLILANYTDECTDLVPLKRYFPNYHDLSMAQLRTYFTWRTKLRRGEFIKVSGSYAYLYIYELLNNIGVILR